MGETGCVTVWPKPAVPCALYARLLGDAGKSFFFSFGLGAIHQCFRVFGGIALFPRLILVVTRCSPLIQVRYRQGFLRTTNSVGPAVFCALESGNTEYGSVKKQRHQGTMRV